MIFNSIVFLVSFACFLPLYWLPWNWTTRKVLLLCASYLFYAAWDPRFVPMLVAVGTMDYFLGNAIHRAQRRSIRLSVLLFSLFVNLGLLSYFKYAGFFMRETVWLAQELGFHPQWRIPSVILPLGISFYTFETISYLVDIYRRKILPTRSYLDYSLFLVFFPHLVAGPIVRAYDFLPQCETPRRFSGDQLGWGLSLMALGLFQKVFLADGLLAEIVDRTFEHSAACTRCDAWSGVLAFAGQIYFDFAGYSLCGIGAALTCGFVLNDNFRAPYAARGFSDFWQRWHISLSSWLRDYLYVSLGGNRHGKIRTLFNLVITMLIGGLWHGASWTFVVWGAMHGAFLVIERLLHPVLPRAVVASVAGRFTGTVLTFSAVSLAWVFFRAESCGQALQMMQTMLVGRSGLYVLSPAMAIRTGIVIGGLLAAQNGLRDSSWEEVRQQLPHWMWSLFMALLILLILFAPGENRAFIYFQF